MVVFNSSPLIYLARIGKLPKVLKAFRGLTIPQHVYAEVVEEGQRLGKPEAALVHRFVREGKIVVTEAGKVPIPRGLSAGEMAAIDLAKKLGEELVVDDRPAYEYARSFGVEAWRTVRVLLLLLRERKVHLPEYKANLARLSAAGFWLTSDVFAEALEEAEGMRRQRG
jgi:hypothetical protein